MGFEAKPGLAQHYAWLMRLAPLKYIRDLSLGFDSMEARVFTIAD